MKFSTRMLLLIVVFVVGLVCSELLHRYVMLRLEVNGPVYKQIVQAKDIVADVLPPPEYAVEAYLVLFQIMHPTDATKIDKQERAGLLKRFRELSAEYESRHQYWDTELAREGAIGEIRKKLLEDSYEPGKQFFALANDNIVESIGDAAPTPEMLKLFHEDIKESYMKHRLAIDKTVKMATEYVTAVENNAKASARYWFNLQLGFNLIGVLLIMAISWAIVQSIIGPINQLINRMQDIAEGAADLTQRVDAHRNDEIGHLGQLINKVITRIHDLIARVRLSSVQLHATGTEIGAAANEQDSHAQNFSASAAQIASAVKEISATGQELLSTTNELQARADQASGLADAGRASLDNMQQSMHHLAEATGSISTKLGVVREKASGINTVVTTITKVADQTNLLSINAAIEAEKAGEAGRGFLVVAREIRRLADQTAVATLDIEQMVRQMQAAVSSGVMEMDKFREDVRSGINQTSNISGQMGQILDQVHSLTQQFHGVREAVSQQSLGAKQIDEAMGHLVVGVRHVAGAASDFNQAASNLRESVGSLQAEVSQFKVSG